MTERGTGRTTAQLREAIAVAKTGTNVVFVVGTNADVMHSMAIAERLEEPSRADRGHRRMNYGPGGEIIFRTAASNTSALNAFVGLVLIDHDAPRHMRDRVFADWNRIARGAAKRAELVL